MQYNTSHFTFVSDETGIANRFAGFFTTQTCRCGYRVYWWAMNFCATPMKGNWILRLKAWGKSEPDSIFAFSITNDSAYVFPITNYQSNLLETKIAGDPGR